MGTRRVVVGASALLVGAVALVGAAGLAGAAGSGAATGASAVAGAPALSFTVDTSIDALDAAPGDGVCDDGTGHCTLRAAVEEVDRRGSARTSVITLAADPVLSIAPTGTDDNSSGDLNISARLEIHGDKHVIRGGGHDRIIRHEGGKLTLVRVLLTGGLLDQSDQGQGGAIWTDGELTVLGSKLILNRVSGGGVEGGAIYAGPSSTLFIGTSQLRDNAANALGGWAIYGGAVSAHGHVTIVQSLLSGNAAFDWFRSTGSGGGLAARGPDATITDSTITANRAVLAGGGVFAQGGSLSLDRTGSTDNRVDGGQGGGIAVRDGSASIDRSTISGNRALYSGAGVLAWDADVRLGRSTLSSNVGGSFGVALATIGTGSVQVESSTIAANQATGGSGPVASVEGSGISLAGTIVDSPFLTACAQAVGSGGWNLASDSSCGLSEASDRGGVAIELGPLADNGGPTRTHLAHASGPAVDAIPAGTAQLCDGSFPTDQRGTARPAGASCDIGAVEGAGPALSPLDLLVDSPSDAADVAVGDGVCRDASGHCTLRAAIQETNARPTADAISVAQPFTITRSGGGLLVVTDHLTIHGGGSVVDAAGVGSVIIQTGAVLDIDHVTLRHGDNLATGPVAYPFAGSGGGIGSSGDLHLRDSALTDNGRSYVHYGAALYHVGNTELTVERTSILHNGNVGSSVVTTEGGRAVIDHSALAQNVGTPLTVQNATSTVTNSTIADNEANAALASNFGTISLVADTIAGNGNVISYYSGEVTAAGSILHGSTGGVAPCLQGLTSVGYNTSEDTSCGLTEPTDRQGVDVPLGPLADNGGPSPTRLAGAGSAAIDAIPIGTAGLCDAERPDDQRGIARPQGSACDIGATEGATTILGPLSLTVDSAADIGDAAAGDGRCDDGSGHCTLRAAIDEANRADTDDVITIAPGVDPTLSIPSSGDQFNAADDLDSAGPLTIHGNGATLDAGGIAAAIDQHTGALRLDHLTVTGGLGGAISSMGEVDLDHVTVTRNITRDEPTVRAGSASIMDSTISYNSGDGQFEHGALVVTGPLDLVRSTVDHNRSNSATLRGVDMTIVDSTISDNVAISTNWITNYGRTAVLALGTKTTISSSTIAANAAPMAVSGVATVRGSIVDDPEGVACNGQITSTGHNLVSDTSCGSPAAGDQLGVSPRLGTLADHGGPTRTRLLLADSPAVDAVPTGTADLCDGSLATDQRGIARPQGAACDIGAVEGTGSATSGPLSVTVDTSADTVDSTVGDGICDDGTGHCSLRAAVQETNAAVTDDIITIASGVDPTLSRPPTEGSFDEDGDLEVLGGLVLHGGGATLDAAHLDRALRTSSGAVTIDALTIVHGHGGGRGGAIVADGPLSLHEVTVRDSDVYGAGNYGGVGGGVAALGPLEMTSSTVAGNVAGGDGGGIYAGGVTTITDSTVAANHADGQFSSGGGIASTGAALAIDRSTISGNRANYQGGGISTPSRLSLTRSTVSANVLVLGGGGGTTASGVYAANGGPILASTIVGNTTPVGASALSGPTLTVTGSIVSDTTAACGIWGSVDSTFDLVSDGTCGVPAAPSSLLLGALADNGGPTLTILPGAGSPAIDAIPAGTAGLCDATLPTDQRGAVRPHGPACDIGSVER